MFLYVFRPPLCPSSGGPLYIYNIWFYFDVLLTVHYSNDQFLFQLMHHNFTLLTKSLYMFRAPTCPSSQTYQPYSRHKR